MSDDNPQAAADSARRLVLLSTFCPNCKKTVVERDIFAVTALNLSDGKCRFCGTRIAGVWA